MHERRHLLAFDADVRGEMRFTRLDNGVAVEVSFSSQPVPRPAGLRQLMHAALSGHADPATRQAFGRVWQEWVRTILLEHADDPAVILMED